jgi:signal peptidase I
LAYLIYSILGMILRVSMPLAIVVSTSRTPTLNKGDVVILTAPENLNVPIITINDNIKEKRFI